MSSQFLFNASALIALIPPALLAFRKDSSRDLLFWLMLAVAVAGPASLLAADVSPSWRTGFATALWATITATMAVFTCASALQRDAWRLAPLICPYMVVLGGLAMIWGQASESQGTDPQVSLWVIFHIVLSVITYALVTLAAVSALAAVLQERALKAKQRGALTRVLPSVVDCDALGVRLLAVGLGVLVVGLISGMALQYAESGQLINLDHKSILIIAATVVIAVLLIVHARTGIRGRQAARLVLLAYLLLTLGYPGVKFVTDVILR